MRPSAFIWIGGGLGMLTGGLAWQTGYGQGARAAEAEGKQQIETLQRALDARSVEADNAIAELSARLEGAERGLARAQRELEDRLASDEAHARIQHQELWDVIAARQVGRLREDRRVRRTIEAVLSGPVEASMKADEARRHSAAPRAAPPRPRTLPAFENARVEECRGDGEDCK